MYMGRRRVERQNGPVAVGCKVRIHRCLLKLMGLASDEEKPQVFFCRVSERLPRGIVLRCSYRDTDELSWEI